ncbi:MAG: SAF domain-containing protein [Ilumatobacteraceae bacterium]
MANQAVVENLTRTRARAMQDRVETTQSEHTAKRRWRIPELAVGLVLMLGGALGAILLSRSGDSIVTVVGAAHDLQRGDKITPQDLVAVETSQSLSGSFITEAQASALIGQTALVDLEASTPLTVSMFSDQQQLLPNEALTSAAIQQGNYPIDLAVGDQVRIVTVPDIALSQNALPELFDQVVTIWSLNKSENNDSALVTFRSSLDLSMAIAKAGEVHIVRVADFQQQSSAEGSQD